MKPRALLWAVFLATSWTWCIGMFLPVLLIRDYGVWGWVVFAIPNVLGAAAMGWTVRDADHSRRLMQAHPVMTAMFAIVTAAFQCFFAVWYFRMVRFTAAPALFAVPLVCFAPLILSLRRRESLRLSLAVVTYAVSLGCLAMFIHQRGIHIPIAAESPHSGSWALALACAWGFALCPYLDLTFHDARQHTGVHEGRFAFGLGFGVFFFLMIIFSLLYSRLGLAFALFPVAVHIAFQLTFTTIVHLRELWRTGQASLRVIGAVAAIGAATLGVISPDFRTGELIYRLFMSFYGLVFPAYVWLCMLPGWRNPSIPSKQSFRVFAAVVGLAAPFYWAAFVAERMSWVLPGLLIVLLSRALVGARFLRWTGHNIQADH